MHLRNVTLAALFLAAALTVFAQNPVTMDSPYQVSYAGNLNLADSYVDIINDGATGAPLSGPGIGGAVGNLCVNVYAFDPAEEMISCCSCLVTPDQTRSLSVRSDILSNTATGVVPTSITIKLVSTPAGAGGTGTSCTNSAATITALATGLVAYGTTIHSLPTIPGGLMLTEKPFIPGTLSASEAASLTNRCTGIMGNLSGFGICASCRSGALGAGKMQ